ncbi:rare lipoprotein A [Chitinivibrio alkaliphilus ACht1]|uniref:Probable endolytic peptidoglycan transglycosylase RlpA n=1 Tax=Chitinivibrio alkaliphilus ACht1 TaxID=1313304 RepID=U7DAD3_9BACT|nr:septal ring lytic transglycosylase RlpA family protein [Chitinivibrio alkaliphilus]ERP32092.1 rare lipoprotein A [Chitinivibrio alkaliphilus ACht1]
MHFQWSLFFLVIFLVGCSPSPRYATIQAQNRQGKKAQQGDHELQGKASWYGRKFHGRTTASGETYNMRAMTAAHKTLPFGTRVRVTHQETGRSVIVTINDRGPFVEGRVIDLSRRAADRLGIRDRGVAPVSLTIL